MPARVSEAFVLRSYPYQEADLIVSLFTRDLGKLRGVAKRARRLKSSFGSGLERLSQVRVSYYQKETLELVRLDHCELIQSQFGLVSYYASGVVLDYIAEVSDQLLPPSEPNERFYRLIAAVLAELRAAPEAGVWRVVLYFSLWSVRLSGILPDLRVSPSSRELAAEMASNAVGRLSTREWTKDTAADLRRFLVRQIEQHTERRLATAPMLEAL
ncbi:MAG: DNA repair protein RecO [Bryobacterales bacterium]|nr:DNA repair protein RecO [Bryobacterales bacterium]